MTEAEKKVRERYPNVVARKRPMVFDCSSVEILVPLGYSAGSDFGQENIADEAWEDAAKKLEA
jgi:hypothetical protein